MNICKFVFIVYMNRQNPNTKNQKLNYGGILNFSMWDFTQVSVKRVIGLILLILVFNLILSNENRAFSQREVTTQHQVWTQYFYNVRMKDKWLWNGDVLYRWKDLNGQALQAGIRNGLTYHFKQPITVTLGYVYFLHFPSDKNKNAFLDYTRQEHRPWQQVMTNSKWGRLMIQHRYRLEQRFMENVPFGRHTGDFRFNFRMRYQLSLQYPLNKKEVSKGTLSVITYSELMVNFGKNIVYDYFDQDRSLIGFSYNITKSFVTTLGYQYIWQQRQTPGRFNSTNCLRLTFIHNIDARKKEEL